MFLGVIEGVDDGVDAGGEVTHASAELIVTGQRGSFLGDIAISPVVACQNAKRFGRTMTEEICILMLHGVLHLLGYDHETDRGEMERVEARLRRRLGLN